LGRLTCRRKMLCREPAGKKIILLAIKHDIHSCLIHYGLWHFLN
jgi:hypothetical protein